MVPISQLGNHSSRRSSLTRPVSHSGWRRGDRTCPVPTRSVWRDPVGRMWVSRGGLTSPQGNSGGPGRGCGCRGRLGSAVALPSGLVLGLGSLKHLCSDSSPGPRLKAKAAPHLLVWLGFL